MVGVNELFLFVLVVEAGSFNKAAAIAGISTPALSKKISKLEKDLSVQLLYRTTRKLSLTEAGETLYQHAKNINQQVNEAIGAVSNFSETIAGEIKLSVPTISGELLLAEIVADFCHQHPDISVNIRLENEFVDLVKGGLDLAIRTGYLEDSTLIAKPLIISHWVVCCSPQYIEKYGKPNTIEDLLTHNCLAYTGQAKGSHDWRFKHNGQEKNIRIVGNLQTNNAQALRKAALAGYGIAYVPRCGVYEDLQSGKLIALLTDYEPRSLGVYAVYSYTRHLPEKIRLLIDHIKQGYQNKAEYF
jgi:DNA-binding transcriptional LysR family regulator